MRARVIGLVIASAALALLPGMAAAQCEGGTSTAGYYLRDGSYVPGGCAFTSSTTPGQLHPSGAQPLPSTNPAQGLSALPGQPVATGLLPVRSGDVGQPFGATGAPGQNLGPGAGGMMTTGTNALPGQVTASGPLPVNTANVGSALGVEGVSNGLTTTVNNGAALGVTTPNINGFTPAEGMVNAITGTRGLPNVTGADAASGARVVGPIADVTTRLLGPNPVVVGNVQAAPANAVVDATAPIEEVAGRQVRIPLNSAYGESLRAAPAPAVSDEVASPTAPGLPPPAVVPGRGGPTFIGEERGNPDQVIFAP